MYQDFTELKRFALKYIKVMIGLNAERRMSAQPLKLVQQDDGDDQDDDEYGDAQDAVDADGDVVEITRLGDMQVEAKVEILAFMWAQGYKPAEGRAASGRFVRAPGGRGRTAPTGGGGGQRRDPPPRGRADMSCVNCCRKGHAAS